MSIKRLNDVLHNQRNNVAVDLFCGGVQPRHKRISKRNLSLQNGLSEAVIKSRYGFSLNCIQFVTDSRLIPAAGFNYLHLSQLLHGAGELKQRIPCRYSPTITMD